MRKKLVCVHTGGKNWVIAFDGIVLVLGSDLGTFLFFLHVSFRINPVKIR